MIKCLLAAIAVIATYILFREFFSTLSPTPGERVRHSLDGGRFLRIHGLCAYPIAYSLQ